MKLDAALKGVTLLGLDTSPFIYLIERNPTYVALTREVFRRINAGSPRAHSSVMTLTEVLVQPLRTGNTALAQRYGQFLKRGRNLALIPFDVAIAEQAAELRARYNIRTPDAVQLATVISAGCTAFLSNDVRLKRVVEIDVLVFDELEL